MSAPIVWILVPGAAALILYLLRKSQRLVTVSAVVLSLALAWLAWRMPLDQPVSLGPLDFQISSSLAVLGRQFILENANRPTLVLVYLFAAVWFAPAGLARPGRLFIPFGLSVVAMMVAALAVEPFLYAALFIEMAALLCVPILASPGRASGAGVLRFLTFQTLGTPFILFTGWVLAEIEVTPLDMEPVLRGGILMALGFAFLLAVFPFHTWIPLNAAEAHPYAAAFVFFMLPGIVSLFGLDFFERYTWLRDAPQAYRLLRDAGLLMMVTSGLWAAFQRHLGRLLGYAVTFDIGLSLVAISFLPQILADTPGLTGLELFSALFVVRGVALVAWALALAVIRQQVGDLRFRMVQGAGRSLPVAAGTAILANFALAGFPLLAAFPTRLLVWQFLGDISPLVVFWALLGAAGLIAGGLRTLAVLSMGPDESDWAITETRPALAFLFLAILALFTVRYFF